MAVYVHNVKKFIVRHPIQTKDGDVLIFERPAEFQSTPALESILKFKNEDDRPDYMHVHFIAYENNGPIILFTHLKKHSTSTQDKISEMTSKGWTLVKPDYLFSQTMKDWMEQYEKAQCHEGDGGAPQ